MPSESTGKVLESGAMGTDVHIKERPVLFSGALRGNARHTFPRKKEGLWGCREKNWIAGAPV